MTDQELRAALAASQMVVEIKRYPNVRDAERRRDMPTTFNIKRGLVPYPGNIDLLGKSHGNGVSKRRQRRQGERT